MPSTALICLLLATASPVIQGAGDSPAASQPVAAAPAPGRAPAQERAAAPQRGGAPVAGGAQREGSRAFDPAARDRRTGFDAASAQAARIELQATALGEPRRAIALVTLGASGAISERATLIAAASEGPIEDRVAALLALGELGQGIGEGLPLLERLATAEVGQIQSACLVALARCNEPQARSSLARFASADGVVAVQAREAMAHAIDPLSTTPPALWRQLYELRWEAARRFGTVDGRPWKRVRTDELAGNKEFLEALVYNCAPDLRHGTARDQMLEVLMQPGRSVARIEAAVQLIPLELERLIESGVWRPSNRAEWVRLVDTIVVREDWRRFPGSLGIAAVTPEVRPIVAAFLHRAGGPYEEALNDAFESDDPRDRANAAYAVGAAGLSDYATVLRDLARDPEPWVQASAFISRVRLGEAAAQREVEAVFNTPAERRTPRLSGYLFEMFERASPDINVIDLLDRIAPTLDESDRLEAEAILVLSGRRSSAPHLREALPSLDPNTPEAFRIIRALGKQPDADDLEALATAFPFDGSTIANLLCASALVRNRHRAVDPLLSAAVWGLDGNLSILAAGIVYETRGAQVLRQWIVRPPAEAREEDVRRLGFALGDWGGPREYEALRAELGTASGAEEPALQGAYIGMLGGRTR
ncbi:MAG: hypothetical protein R3F49_18965 [Planctomycetota bacterium]